MVTVAFIGTISLLALIFYLYDRKRLNITASPMYSNLNQNHYEKEN